METNKVLALAREAGLAVTISSYDALHKFAALLQREWIGLTGDEIENLPNGGTWWEIIRATEEMLKEKNT